MFQALRDTGQPPHHCDWICLARGGRDAKNFTVRGVYRAGERYQALDIVSKNGGSFIARRDDPGECPGDGWANLTMPGKRGAEGPAGPKGDKGDQGAKGDAAPTILEWVLDYDNYRAIPLMSDGSPARCSSYALVRALFRRDGAWPMRWIGISARLSECKRRSDSRAIFVSSAYHRRAAPSYRQTGADPCAAVAAGPAGELIFEVRFRRHLRHCSA